MNIQKDTAPVTKCNHANSDDVFTELNSTKNVGPFFHLFAKTSILPIPLASFP